MNHDTLLVIFVGLTGLALVVEAIVILAAFFLARKTVKKLHADMDELRSKAIPLLSKSHELMEKVSPRIDSISRDMADLSRRAREQGEGFSAAASEILVSRTVKDLVAGSGLHFNDRGKQSLKGLQDAMELYAASS